MSQREAQIQMHKERLEAMTGMKFEDFVFITDPQLDELLGRLAFNDCFEFDHLISRLMYYDQAEDSRNGMLLNHIYDRINGRKD